MDTNNKLNDKMTSSRRKILRSIGMGGIAAAGFSGISSGERPPQENEVKKRTGRAKWNSVAEAVQDDESRALLRYVGQDRWVQDKSEVDVLSVQGIENESRDYDLVILPLEKRGDRSDVKDKSAANRTLIWTDSDDAPHNAVIQEVRGNGESRFFVEDGEVEMEEKRYETSGKLGGISIDSQDDCMYVHEYCTDPNWTCIAAITVLYGACAWAVISGGFAAVVLCLADAGVTLMQAMDEEGCSVCDDVDVRELDVCGSGWEIMPP